MNQTQSMISNSEILYVDPDKKRTDNWLTRTRLQLPFVANRYGSLKSIAYSEGNVKPKNEINYIEYEKLNSEKDRYYISPEFTASYDRWVTAGRPDRKTLTVGRTSEALRSIGVKEQSITWDTSKIIKSLKKHTYLNDGIMKQIPNVLENPIIIMQSTQKDSRVTMFEEVYDGDGLPVMAVLELSPLNRSGSLVLDEIKLASTYSKKKLNDPTSIQRTQSMISNSEILYVDPDKKRTDNWLTLNRLQLPLSVSRYGSLKSITYSEGNVKQKSGNNSKNQYNIFNIKEVDGGVVPSHRMNTNRGSLATSTSVDSITRDSEYVKQNFPEIIKNTERNMR